MPCRDLRIRIGETGRVEVVDPAFADLPFLRSIDPGFRILTAPLPGFTIPGFQRLRMMRIRACKDALADYSEASLWGLHAAAMREARAESPRRPPAVGEASLLDLKAELAHRLLQPCRLCPHRCGVDRARGELGLCGLGAEARLAESFVHIAEEPFINPSLVVSLAGCGLKCRFCQQERLLRPDAPEFTPLADTPWSALPRKGARSISFLGGNPDESLPAILQFLNDAPASWRLPVVWNSNAFATPETLALLEGVVDAYVPDYKFGNKACAARLSTGASYPEAAREAIRLMLRRRVPVIVRLLVLPGHAACCHSPAVENLAAMDVTWLWISLRGEYCPEERDLLAGDELSRRPAAAEIAAVRDFIVSRNLRVVA